MYADCADYIRRTFPGIEVTGELYPPSRVNSFLASVLQYAFFGGIAVCFLGQHVLPAEAARWLAEHRGLAIMGIFMCNILAGKLMTTGAFEISLNGTLVFSKIKEGRLFSFPELKFMIEQARELEF